MELSPDERIFWAMGVVKLNMTVVVTWLVMILMVTGAALITRGLRTDIAIPRRQGLLEMIVSTIKKQSVEIGLRSPRRYLPFRRELTDRLWPGQNVPEAVKVPDATLRALVREHIFVSIFRAVAESLASENASRLAAMQRADRSIDFIIEDLTATYHCVRAEANLHR